MDLKTAKILAGSIVTILEPHCQRIEIVGSIRRQRPKVKDIDLLLIPLNQGQLLYALQTMMGVIKPGRGKLIRCQTLDTQVDIYIATPETWATLLLIRTGSASHNIKLCSIARAKGLKLHADGSGVTREGGRSSGDTEESIFAALGMPYIPPEQREV